MAKMKFGIMLGQAAGWNEVADMWRFVDRETAFHSAYVFDHFVAGDPRADANYDGICLEGWSALSALAAITDRVRLGVLVTGVTYRNPALLAKMAVTVDHISNGRLELGIGAAWHEPEHRMYGWDYPSNREREDRLEEAVRLIRRLFESNGRVTFEGAYYHLQDAVFDPKPLQKPRIPILIGGGGEKRTLRTLARYGDIMNTGGTPDIMRHKIDVLERHCRDAGRDPSEIEKTYWGPIIVSDNERLVERVAQMSGAPLGLSPEDAKRVLPIGNAGHVRSVVEEYARAGVQRMVMMSQAPWKQDLYRRINDELVRAFE
ncbi:MAG: TIGR03560 family F420-dependent LLM class oxidoreductase [Chloroflexota bacterium]|nr:TIGR03560 family F420-dependent LLM class oxidoreductase [Chloroflexota bacterium]